MPAHFQLLRRLHQPQEFVRLHTLPGRPVDTAPIQTFRQAH